MKIYIDIGHPAHVLFFKSFISQMTINGHTFLISARDKDITIELLKRYCIKYFPRGKGSYSTFGRIWYLIKTDIYLIRRVKLFDPDICIGMSSPYLSHVAAFIKKPSIIYEDTESARWVHKLYLPFTEIVLTPSCFKLILGARQIAISSFKEFAYLHPNYYQPDNMVFNTVNPKSEKLTFIRFVSRNNNHDKGKGGLSEAMKIKLIKHLQKFSDVMISTEKGLPVIFPELEINLQVDKIHSLLASANLYIGESATMAAEAVILGVPAVYLDNNKPGYIDELNQKYHMLYSYGISKDLIDKALAKACEILKSNEKATSKSYHQKLLDENIDLTAFLVWFVENYPDSARIMRENPDYQYRFR